MNDSRSNTIRPVSAPPVLDRTAIIRTPEPQEAKVLDPIQADIEISHPEGGIFGFDVSGIPEAALFGRINVHMATRGGEMTTIVGALMNVHDFHKIRQQIEKLMVITPGFTGNIGTFAFLHDPSEMDGTVPPAMGSSIMVLRTENLMGFEMEMFVWHPNNAPVRLFPYMHGGVQ